jgi:uncharacterized protein (DUF58 family)
MVLARLSGRGGNRVGALLYDGVTSRVVPPGTGRRHVLRIGHELERTATPPKAGETTDVAAMLGAVASLARRRSLVVVVSDFIGAGEWDRPLLRLAQRPDVVALRLVDAADDNLPEAGLVLIEDTETAEQLLVDSSDPLLRARLRAAVDERESALAIPVAVRRRRRRRRRTRPRTPACTSRPSVSARPPGRRSTSAATGCTPRWTRTP